MLRTYTLQVLPHVWVLPPLYTVCYALWALPHAWVLPPLYTVCYVLWVLPHMWVLLPLYTVCSVYYAVWVLPHVWDYFIHYAGNFTQHVFKRELLCFECAAYVRAAWPCLNVAEFGGNWAQLNCLMQIKNTSNSDSLV